MMSKSTGQKREASRQPLGRPIVATLSAFAAEFDRHFEVYLIPVGDAPPGLVEAIRYSALAPGKRIRPFLVKRCCELAGGSGEDAWPAAAAIECIHAFSLIHDDLPAMDDDDLRRGRPACHKKFGEALAILAGDALIVLAFDLLSRHVADRGMSPKILAELARGAGWTGMIGGQTADILGQSQPPALELAQYIHRRKTASLFETSCRLGIIAGRGSVEQADSLGRFGQMLGRAFQIVDDLLDVTSTADVVGKSVGKDERASKQTFPKCLGIEESRKAALTLVDRALVELEPFGLAADDLRCLARFVVDRNY